MQQAKLMKKIQPAVPVFPVVAKLLVIQGGCVVAFCSQFPFCPGSKQWNEIETERNVVLNY